MQFITLILLALIASVTHAEIRRVPSEYPTIQAAILAAQDQHDTVLVYDGTYVENLDFRGRSIVVGRHRISSPADLKSPPPTAPSGTGAHRLRPQEER